MKKGRPKLEPSSDAHRVLQQADRLGLEIKPVKLGKDVVLFPQRIRRALRGGEKIRIGATIIDPAQLPLKIDYPKGIAEEHGETPAGRLYARGFLTHEMYEAAKDFGDIYARAFPKRGPKIIQLEGMPGGKPNPVPFHENGYEKYRKLCDFFKERSKYYHLCHLITFAYNSDPAWINAKQVKWAGVVDQHGEPKILAPKDYGYEHRALVTALQVYIETMGRRRAA